ncbi:hypothetical protein [Sorangium sp. So ce406]|uniref:hypothetical protein n=1 Tax=Sorangium sp. So ce406 TaxID=3133311 RepID=UPI003F5BC940
MKSADEQWSNKFEWARNRKHNDLFRPGEYAHLNACVGSNGGPYDLDDYAQGYFRAGHRLVQSIIADTLYIDLLVYPLVFTYRHALELGIKYLATRLPPLWDEEPSPKLTHKLLDNWRLVRPLLERDEAFSSSETVPTFEKILKDFVELDARGEAFRFPEDKDANHHLAETSHINVLVVGETMVLAHDLLSFWAEMTRQLWSTKCEMDDARG